MRMRSVILAPLLVLLCMSSPRATWAQAEVRSGHFVTSDGVELHYLEAGSGPTLVFVPGWTMPAEIWEAQLGHFASTHRVVALDPRGHLAGFVSEQDHGGHSVQRLTDLADVLGKYRRASATARARTCCRL